MFTSIQQSLILVRYWNVYHRWLFTAASKTRIEIVHPILGACRVTNRNISAFNGKFWNTIWYKWTPIMLKEEEKSNRKIIFAKRRWFHNYSVKWIIVNQDWFHLLASPTATMPIKKIGFIVEFGCGFTVPAVTFIYLLTHLIW